MLSASLFVVLIVLVAGSAMAVPTGKRLISFEDDLSKAVWMSEAEIDAMAAKRDVGFVDVTEYQAPRQLGYKVAIPTAPAFPSEVAAVTSQVNGTNWWAIVAELEAMGTRHRQTASGIATPGWILEQMRSYGSGSNLSIEYELFEHTSIPQASTITRIIGCDASVVDEIVIIGGHEDSTSTNINIAPGADDDATGTATVMEIFRTLAQSDFCPRRTIEFHTYAGEEGGLIGSNSMANAYNQEGINVISMVQFDMTSYNDAAPIALIQDYTSNLLNTFLSQLLDAYVPELDYTRTSSCGYGCSDHAAWHNRGYPAAFPFEAPFGSHNPSIHTANDVSSRISQQKGQAVLKLAVAYLVEMSLF